MRVMPTVQYPQGVCVPRVYVDGVVMAEGWEATVAPDDILGLEIYSRGSLVPSRFGGGSAGCGAIVIWTG